MHRQGQPKLIYPVHKRGEIECGHRPRMSPQVTVFDFPASTSSASSDATVLAVASVSNHSYPMRLSRSPSAVSFEAEIMNSIREEELDLSELLRMPSPSPPASSFVTNEFLYDQYSHRHRHSSPQPSYTTSTISSESLITDYGLHRALHSIVVPNHDNPIATLKDRKNANYLEKLEDTHIEIKKKLDQAIADYKHVTELRESNEDPKLEFLLNRQYLNANNALARSSRQYNAYIDSLNELRAIPRVTRQEMKVRYTDVRTNVNADKEDNTSSAVQHQLRKTCGEISSLEEDRQNLIEVADPIGKMTEHVAHVENHNDTLAEHVGYVEHLNTQLKHDVKKWTAACNALQHRVSQLEKANMELNVDVQAHRSHAITTKDQLNEARQQLGEAQQKLSDAQQEFKRIHSQLGFATATAKQHKDESHRLRLQFDDSLVAASEEMEDLVNRYEALQTVFGQGKARMALMQRANQHLKDEFAELVAQTSHKHRQDRKRSGTL